MPIRRKPANRLPTAIRCADPFHVVAWATEALDTERRRAWNDARALARTEAKWGRGRPGKNRGQAMNGPGGSRVPVFLGGRTPRTSPNARTPSWPGSPRPIPGSIAPICSKRACGMCFRSGARKVSRPCTGGSPGRGVVASRYSWSWPAASFDTARPSMPPWTTAYRRD